MELPSQQCRVIAVLGFHALSLEDELRALHHRFAAVHVIRGEQRAATSTYSLWSFCTAFTRCKIAATCPEKV
jgi:hypothetical protein